MTLCGDSADCNEVIASVTGATWLRVRDSAAQEYNGKLVNGAAKLVFVTIDSFDELLDILSREIGTQRLKGFDGLFSAWWKPLLLVNA